MSGRSFLFLQGPPGPFFGQLADGLRGAGHRCCRVNLNGGDWFDWRGPAIRFSGTLDDWPDFLADLLIRQQVSDIVLFGDCRSYHLVARETAEAFRITVHVFEEGYIRPDWITLEQGGVNGNSPLPRTAAAYRALAASLPVTPSYPYVPSSFAQRAREAAGYFLSTVLLTPLYPAYRSHRPYSVMAELRGWIGRLLARPLARKRSAHALERLGARRFFLLPLQLDSDHQIRIHSPFSGMRDALEAILASFALHAPEDTMLLIKEHPLDNGLHDWRRTAETLSADLKIADRVCFIEHGDLYTIVEQSAGVVTVNSTTGTLALAAGIPVIVLGTAVYDVPGVTSQASLDRFWAEPDKPDMPLYDSFRRVLVAHCLIRGGFSSRAGRALLVPNAIERLLADVPSEDRCADLELAVA